MNPAVETNRPVDTGRAARKDGSDAAPMGLTRELGAFVEAMISMPLPATCIEGASIGIADCIGVLIAGSDEPAPAIVRTLVAPTAEAEDYAPEIPSGRRLSSIDAALVNGVAAHVLDYDDVALSGHPSTVLAPAILAEGWAARSSGSDLLSAYVTGYEIWALLDELEPGQFHERGFHPTALLGAVAAAAACARLRRFDAATATHAVAIAASLASGLVANFGTMTKSLHAGRTAQAGVFAARLAARGYTGSLDVFEHRTGYMRAHSPSGEPDLSVRDHGLGRQWRLPGYGVHIKRYPTCYATHRSIDALLELVTRHEVRPAEVERIQVDTGETQMLMLRNHAPTTGLEAKFSMQFAMASALVARQVGLAQLTDAFVRRDAVVDAMRKVQCATTTERVIGWDQPFAPADRVRVVLRDGRELASEPIERPKGSWQRRMTAAELQEKFMDCASIGLDRPSAQRLFEQLTALGELASVRDLALIAAAPARRGA